MKLKLAIVPGSKNQPEIVKATAGSQDSISKAVFAISDFVFDNAIAFNAADGMFHPNAERGKPTILLFVKV